MFHVKQPPEGAARRGGGDEANERGAGAGPDVGDGEGAARKDVAGGHADAALVVYREQLARYRRTLDLMSDRGYADLEAKLAEAERYAAAVRRHAAPGGAVLDLGTGAGLPGVVVAARLAPRRVWWVERRRRRAAFLDQVAARAGLREVRVAAVDVRALEVGRTGPVAAVTAQAVAALDQVATLTRHLWADDVLLVSRKGPGWEAEVEALRAAARGWGAQGRGAEGSGAQGGGTEGVGAQGGPVAVQVIATEALGSGGTLVAVRVRGGSACPPSA